MPAGQALLLLYFMLLPVVGCAAAVWCVDPFRLWKPAFTTAIKLTMLVMGAGFFLSQMNLPPAALGGIGAGVLVLGTMNEVHFNRKFPWPRSIAAAALCALFCGLGLWAGLAMAPEGLIGPPAP